MGVFKESIDKLTILVLFILVALAAANIAQADSTIKIQYGLGFHPETYLSDKIRSVNIGHYSRLEKSVSYALTAGYLGDKTFELETGYACAQFGTQIRALSFLYVDNYFGPCYFHEAHGAISGHLQFATNIGFGWRDKSTGSEIGINWKHFSNAGLSKPNLGLDLIMLSLGFGL